jgi:hypothetical protein
MWIVIHIAHSEKIADEICSILANEGFLVKRRAIHASRNNFDNGYEIRVLKSEAIEARDILHAHGI